MAKSTYKPLLYTTTIRNPERYKDFMHILKRFDGQILTETTIGRIECELFKVGLYRPVNLPPSVKSKWASTKPGEFAETPLEEEECKLVYSMNFPNHKEAGFAKGWPSRFDTQFKLMKTLGFVYYEMGKPIEFSPTGNYLAQTVEIKLDNGVVERNIVNPRYEQTAFMQAFAKQQRCNPFIRELNDNIPLILLLEVIKKLNADTEFNNSGISYRELPLLLVWRNNDSEALYQRIKHLRRQYRYNPSTEVIEDICINEILGGFKKFKPKSIVAEYPDDFVRKMRMTGLITLRGGGRFIDINHLEDAKVEYILEHYSKYVKYTSHREYFDYMALMDPNLFALRGEEMPKTVAAQKLINMVREYPWETIETELTNLATRSSSKHDVLRFIAAPARLELLTALAIKSKLPHVDVIPNYPCDDEGLPTSTAGGNAGDIECYEYPNGVLVEVTMAEGRQQTIMEVWPITRHLTDFKQKIENGDTQCMFVAPSIFSDSERQIKFVDFDMGLKIRPYKISEFMAHLTSCKSLYNPS